MLDMRIVTFLAVCRNMSFTRAAGELCITQPAVSQHIRSLEEYYGVKLFRYTGKKLYLTGSGEYLRRSFETIRNDADRVRERIGRAGVRPALKLGATMSIGGFYLPARLGRYLAAHPDVDLSLTIQDTKDLLRLLEGGEVELAFCEGYFNKAEHENRLIRRERIECFCGREYPLPDAVSIEELFAHRILLREEGSGTREVFERMLRARGYEIGSFPNRCQVNDPHTILQLLLAGAGISFLYRTVGEALAESGRLRTVRVADFGMEHEFNAVWNKSSLFSPEYGAIVDEITRELPFPSPAAPENG